MATIYLTDQERYTSEAFPSILHALDLEKKLQEASLVVIKPNLVGLTVDKKRLGTSTPLWIIEKTVAGIRACNQTARILIVESDSGNQKHAREKFINHGLPLLEERDQNLFLYNLSENPTNTIPYQGKYFKRRMEMPAIFQQDMFFISLAKVKTHRSAVFSGILKNQFGCLPEIQKAPYHPYLDRVLADLNAYLHPTLSILEACPAMEGNGPLHGQDREWGLIACSDNPVELDAYLLKVTGLDRFNPKYVKVCRAALKEHYTMGPPTIIHEELATPIQPFLYVNVYQRRKMQLGLIIQWIGQKIANAGQRIQRK